ncbi:MAG: MauE/DoxX family redox-associated membrane protein [Pseudomonadota bacterium]
MTYFSRTPAGWVYLALRLALGAVFVYAGAVKLMDPKAFAITISRYGLAPDFLLAPAALGLPALEVLAGLGLIFEVRGSLNAITTLLLMFATVLWFGVLQGLSIDCGCFSAEEQAGHDDLRTALHRDLVMLAAAAYLYFHRWRARARRGSGGWRFSHLFISEKEEVAP